MNTRFESSGAEIIRAETSLWASFTSIALIPTDCGYTNEQLATGSLFIEDVTEPRPLIDGQLEATPAIPDPARLADLAAAPERRDWWFEPLR